jgi:UMF1 family MFS transporter
MGRLWALAGLDTRELRAWALYDWANSAFWCTVVVAVFPPFFSDYAAAGLEPVVATTRFAWITAIGAAVIALLGPILGAIADYRAIKKPMLAASVAIGAIATLLMATIERGGWVYAAAVFVVANVGIAASLVFYDSFLPHLVPPERMDRVSTAGYALGFVGGGVLLLINLAWILSPATFGLSGTVAAIKLSFVSVAVWWVGFSIPILRRVPEPPAVLEADETGRESPVRIAFVRVFETFHELRGHRDAFLMLLAFLIYNDGIQTFIRMASIYGAEVGIDRNAQIAAFVIVQFVGVPCSFLFGAAAGRVGVKPAIYFGLAVYTLVSVLAFFISTEWHFFALAVLVGLVQGGSQALSRSLFARLIPRRKSSEYFGFFAVADRFAGILGPAVFAMSVTATGSSRGAVVSVILFFVIGALVLTRVNVARGEAHAAEINRVVSSSPA